MAKLDYTLKTILAVLAVFFLALLVVEFFFFIQSRTVSIDRFSNLQQAMVDCQRDLRECRQDICTQACGGLLDKYKYGGCFDECFHGRRPGDPDYLRGGQIPVE